MAKETTVKIDGIIVEALPNTMFRVKLETEQVVLGYISGRMRQNEIKILMGDPVELEFSPYDLSRGRIVKRK
jgi:translation initiation factor IF-1